MIREVQQEMGSSIMFVTHDMAVHANMADRLGIMYAGRLVEEAPTAEIFAAPLHPYTAHLIQQPAADRRPRRARRRSPARRRTSPRRRRAAASIRAARSPWTSAAASAGADDARARPSRRLLRGQPRGQAGGTSASRGAGGAHERRPARASRRHPELRHGRACFGRGAFDAVDDVSFALRDGTAGDLHHRRRVRQRQDDAGADDPQPHAADARAPSASAARTSAAIRGGRGADGLHGTRSSRSSRTRSRPSIR